MAKDLHDFIDLLEKNGELLRVNVPVDPVLEIAEITGTSEATVRTRLHYAKQQLQGILKDYISQ